MPIGLVLGGGAPNLPLMTGALLALDEAGVDFRVITTTGAGMVVGLLYAAPRKQDSGDSWKKTRRAALKATRDWGIDDFIYDAVPINYKILGNRAPVLEFPGTRHGVADAAGGAWTPLSLRPVRRLRDDCVPLGIDAWMVDHQGPWFSVETAMRSMPLLRDETDLAFGVLVPAASDAGRAKLLVQTAFDCGTHRQVETVRWQQFQVTPG